MLNGRRQLRGQSSKLDVLRGSDDARQLLMAVRQGFVPSRGRRRPARCLKTCRTANAWSALAVRQGFEFFETRF